MLAVIGGIAAVAAIGLVATTASARTHDDVTLRVSLFGDFGYHDLYKQYEAAHPGVTIKEEIQDYGTHHTQLAQHIATGAGAADVEAIEVGFIPQFTAAAAELRRPAPVRSRRGQEPLAAVEVPAGSRQGRRGRRSRHGRRQPRDLLPQGPVREGRPADRTASAVSKLWPTWQAYINTGKRYQAKAPKGTFFFDSGSNVYNAMVGQLNPAYYNAAGKVIAATNPSVKAAYNLTISGWQAGEDAGLAAFSTDWNTGYKKGLFATVTCPAWMMGYIQGQAPATKGKWDIAATPGTGGNWGGSFLAVPKQSSHQDEAADLVKFLTSPASERAIFKQTGNLPSQTGPAQGPGRAELQEPVLQQRPGRPDLRQLGAPAEAADPGTAPG